MEKLNYFRKEAAEAGGISLPTLDALLNRECDPIPHFRVGRKVLIPVDGFRNWLAAESERQMNGRAV